MDSLKGWRTVAVGLAVAVIPTATQYLAGVDWSKLVGPQWAFAISGVLMVGLRLVTDSAVGKK